MPVVGVIGSGFSGLSAAAYLSVAGFEVHVYEKNGEIGGRARQLKTASGYVFDMGPSWYWMPDIFENFFNDFGHTASDYYDLELLDPSFQLVLPGFEKVNIPADFSQLEKLFESFESGSAARLRQFMHEAKFKYEMGMKKIAVKRAPRQEPNKSIP